MEVADAEDVDVDAVDAEDADAEDDAYATSVEDVAEPW